MAKILSIQSHVAFGHVGNAAVTFPLQVLGHEVWPVPTAVLSNHAGYPDTGGARLDPTLIDDVLTGLDARGASAACDVLLTGYLGSAETGAVVGHHVARLRTANPRVLYCCDPVMGDRDSGFYVEDGLVRHFKEKATPAADVLTPNLFELELLAGRPECGLHGATAVEIATAAREVAAGMRPGARVMVTSVEASDVPTEHMTMMAVDAAGAWLVQTPRLAFTKNPHGAGDLASALFAVALAEGHSPEQSLSDMASRLFAVLNVAAETDSPELDLVGARAKLCHPPQRFDAHPIE